MRIPFVIGLICFAKSVLARGVIDFGAFSCPAEDKALSCCLKKHLRKYLPRLRTGFRSLQTPSVECLCLPCLTMKHCMGPCCFSSDYSCVQIKGFSHLKICDVRVKSREREVTIRMCIPKLTLRGCYEVTYCSACTPTKSSGRFCAVYKGIDALMTFTVDRLHQKNDVDKLCTGFVHFDFNIKDINMQVEKMRGTLAILDDQMYQCFKDSWRNLAWKLKCPMEMALSDYFLTLINKVLCKLNADCVLPDCKPFTFSSCKYDNTTNLDRNSSYKQKPDDVKVTLDFTDYILDTDTVDDYQSSRVDTTPLPEYPNCTESYTEACSKSLIVIH